MRLNSNLREGYSPLFFLAALGNGGLSVAFFMFLMFMTPHQGQPIPTYETWTAAFHQGGSLMQWMILFAVLGIVFFAANHIRLLAWNVREFLAFKTTEAFRRLRSGNTETQLMAIPLTFAMSINVGFILGALFVPGLWTVVEYLFPAALFAFGLVGYFALAIYGDFFTRILTRKGGFACAQNNNLGQMVSIFAFAMIGVGLAAPAAMSHTGATIAVAYIASTFFIAAAVLLGLIKLTLGFRAMMEHGAGAETTPTIWIVIPILTVVGIAIYRLNMALAHHFDAEWAAGSIFAFLTTLFAIQLLFGLLGYGVMKRVGYFARFVDGPEKSPGAYTLICPGVALFVAGNFLVNAGLVNIGIVEKFSAAYFLLYVPLLILLAVTIRTMFKLNGKLLKADRPVGPSAAAAG